MFPGLVPTWARAAARWCGLHLALSGAVEAVLAWSFGHGPRPVAAHLLLLAEWDLALVGGLCLATSLASAGSAGPQRLAHALLALTGTLQIALYALNTVSNLAWGRNMTGHLVSAFAPTIMSGREPFPVGPAGIVGFGAAVVLATAAAARPWSHGLMRGLRTLPIGPATGSPRWLPGPGPFPRVGRATGAIVLAAASAGFGATVAHGIGGRDSLYWKHELVSSFFRPEGFAFEPTERRLAVAERDAALRTAYSPKGALAPRKHVVLIIVDSLRADRMQVYGYGRDTTPFLSRLVATGRMRRVEAAFSTCSESFCGITSTLASREFRSLSARTFALQDVLQDQGYRARFLLSGNHRAWNGLAGFYRVPEDSLFDGSQTERFTMDDDRLVLEGLERVPAATADRPTFFYVHLMSTHYLGVQFPESHVFTARDDRVSPGLEPYKILDQLNKPDRYDDKVRQADAVIRLLFDRLRDKGYLDDAVVVVTGDHGEGLGER
ncbi:MAG: sulfatase-like hydrolase/transferase, partial [Vicinamibacterales bacterium]